MAFPFPSLPLVCVCVCVIMFSNFHLVHWSWMSQSYHNLTYMASLTSQLALRVFIFTCTYPTFYLSSVAPNSISHACTLGILTTKPPPWPLREHSLQLHHPSPLIPVLTTSSIQLFHRPCPGNLTDDPLIPQF